MFNRKGQSTLEYAMIISIVVAGLLLMQYYVKRGYSGKLKSASDEMGEQYDPNAVTSNFTINQSSNVSQKVQSGVSTTTHLSDQVSPKTGNESLSSWNTTTTPPSQ